MGNTDIEILIKIPIWKLTHHRPLGSKLDGMHKKLAVGSRLG